MVARQRHLGSEGEGLVMLVDSAVVGGVDLYLFGTENPVVGVDQEADV